MCIQNCQLLEHRPKSAFCQYSMVALATWHAASFSMPKWNGGKRMWARLKTIGDVYACSLLLLALALAALASLKESSQCHSGLLQSLRLLLPTESVRLRLLLQVFYFSQPTQLGRPIENCCGQGDLAYEADAAGSWAEGCQCHSCQQEDSDNDESESLPTASVMNTIVPGPVPVPDACAMRGRRAVELATGKGLKVQLSAIMEDKVTGIGKSWFCCNFCYGQ